MTAETPASRAFLDAVLRQPTTSPAAAVAINAAPGATVTVIVVTTREAPLSEADDEP